MRIFYDHQVFSLQNAGGAARYHFELIKHLQQFDVEISLAVGLNASVYPFAELRNAQTSVFSIPTNLHPGVLRYSVNEALTTAIAASSRKFDIYHPTLYRANKTVRCRSLVVTHHDCAHERYPQMFRNSSLVIKNKQRLYKAADAIICVSESSRRDLLHFYDLNSDCVFVVPHGFAPRKDSAGPRSGDSYWRHNNPYILYVGCRGTYKNFGLLLKAYAATGLARDYELLTVGGGDFSPAECEEARRLGVEKRLRNLHGISDSLLSLIYRDASLLVYPSLHEGFGFPPLEAMSNGCPVLASNTSSMPEVCGDAAFYFDPYDEDDLANQLARVLNGSERHLLTEKGYARISHFDWHRTAAKTYAIYTKVTGRPDVSAHEEVDCAESVR